MSCDMSLIAAATKPLQVYILAGQSNMQGHAHFKTLPYVEMDPETAPYFEMIQPSSLNSNDNDSSSSTADNNTCQKKNNNGNAKPTFRECDNVWISVVGCSGDDETERHGKLTVGYGANRDKIGPELMFGMALQEKQEKNDDQPILIIKTAWGGTSLHTDFRPPSAGAFEYTETQLHQLVQQRQKQQERQKEHGNNSTTACSISIDELKDEKRKASGHYYRLMMKHIRHVLQNISRICPTYNAELGYKLSGFVWFQGWNDVVDRFVYSQRDKPGGYDEYGRLLSLFIQDVRSDLSLPNLPFVIGVIGVGGTLQNEEETLHGRFRKAMEMPVEKDGLKHVVALRTEQFWDTEIDILDQRWSELQTKVRALKKENEWGPKEEQEQMNSLAAERFSPQELTIFQTAKSNFKFHYYGSSKFFVRVGKAFADAIYDLQQQQQQQPVEL